MSKIMNKPITAIIAEDERLMRERILAMLGKAWPELEIMAVATDGLEAISLWKKHRPQIVFLDIRMPGKTGLEVAAEMCTKPDAPHIVFVTAHDEYAIKAFEKGAIDYLLKPLETDRLAATVARLKKQFQDKAHTHQSLSRSLSPPPPPPDVTTLLESLLNYHPGSAKSRLKWIRASMGNQIRLININDVVFFQSDTKYTRIVTHDGEALVRTPLKELLEGLDEDEFWQVHRGTIINARVIDRAVREGPEKLTVYLKMRTEKFAVSRQFFHLFKQS